MAPDARHRVPPPSWYAAALDALARVGPPPGPRVAMPDVTRLAVAVSVDAAVAVADGMTEHDCGARPYVMWTVV